MTGWWLSHPSEKYESQMGLLFPTEWKNKIHVPNHQPGTSSRSSTYSTNYCCLIYLICADYIYTNLDELNNWNVINNTKEVGKCLRAHNGHLVNDKSESDQQVLEIDQTKLKVDQKET